MSVRVIKGRVLKSRLTDQSLFPFEDICLLIRHDHWIMKSPVSLFVVSSLISRSVLPQIETFSVGVLQGKPPEGEIDTGRTQKSPRKDYLTMIDGWVQALSAL